MAESKYIQFSEYESSGIKVTFVKRRQTLDFFGWFDHFVGIEGGSMELGKFLRTLGITLKMCEKALKEIP